MADQTAPKLKQVVMAGDVPALELTPAFGNKSNVTMNAFTTRIAFGEYVAGDQNADINYHTAIVMTTLDAVAMANLILALFSQNQPAQAMGKFMQEQSASATAAGTPPIRRN